MRALGYTLHVNYQLEIDLDYRISSAVGRDAAEKGFGATGRDLWFTFETVQEASMARQRIEDDLGEAVAAFVFPSVYERTALQ